MVDLARAFCAGTVSKSDLKPKWKAILSRSSTVVRVPFRKAVPKVSGPPEKASATASSASAHVAMVAAKASPQPVPAKADSKPKRVRVSKVGPKASVPKGCPAKKAAASKAASKAGGAKAEAKQASKVPAKAKSGKKSEATVADHEAEPDSSTSSESD